jgi:hypothetical protein
VSETHSLERAVGEVVELLARCDYAAIERLSDGVRLSAEEMAGAIAASGRRVVVPHQAPRRSRSSRWRTAAGGRSTCPCDSPTR